MNLLLDGAGRLPTLLAAAVLVAACDSQPEAAAPVTGRFSDTAVAYADPGLPSSYYGPKCSFSHSVGKAPSCISAVITPVPEGVHLFLNFCVRNEMNICAPEPEVYLSLLLPLARWDAAARVTQAIGGRAWIQLYDGRVHEARAEANRPLPIDLEITERPVTGGGLTYLGVLHMTLPRLDADGEPLQITADIP